MSSCNTPAAGGTKPSKKVKSDSKETPGPSKATGRWTREEHFRFLEALKLYGKEWKRVQQHVGTRSSTQARSHAQKFFVKLEKKQVTMEEFLQTLDMSNLKVMMENDSDYGEEVDMATCNEAISVSAASISVSQSAKSGIKSPKSKYRKPSFSIQQPRQAFPGKQNNIIGPDPEVDLSLQDRSESQSSPDKAGQRVSTCLTDQTQVVAPVEKQPSRADSDKGVPPSAISPNYLQPDSSSTQCTQPVFQKVTHKTPQIRPSQPSLTVPNNIAPDNYSNDDKQNEVFALPLVGMRRKASEAGLMRPTHSSSNKRQNVRFEPKAEARVNELGPLEMKRTQSAFGPGEKPFTSLFQEKLGQDGLAAAQLDHSVSLLHNLQMPLKFPSQLNMFGAFQLPMGLSATQLAVDNPLVDASQGQIHNIQPQPAIQRLAETPQPPAFSKIGHQHISGQISLPLQYSQSLAPPVTVSQTPRLKAKTMTSPILGPLEMNKRATSVLDHDCDLMGLSRNNAIDDDSFLLNKGSLLEPFEDFNFDFVNKEEPIKMPFTSSLDHGFQDADPLLGEEGPFQVLPGPSLAQRHRSLTFHFPGNTQPQQFNDIFNNMQDQGQARDTNQRMSFDFYQNNNV